MFPIKKVWRKVFFFVAQSSIGAKSFYSSISSYSNRLWWLINISISLSFILLHFNLSSIYFSIVPSCRDYKSAIKYVFCLKSHERRPDLVRVFHFWHSRRFQLGYSNFLFISNQLESWLNYDVRRPSKKAIIFAPSQSAEIKLDVKEIHSWFCVEMCLNH